MPSTLVATTLQAAGFSALSNLLAQALTSYQSSKPFSLDWTPLFQFTLWAMISTPPNILWQDFLESAYPSEKVDEKGQKKLSKWNTFMKFMLDQTIGSVLNNAAFIAGMSTIKGKDSKYIQHALRNDLFHIIKSSWKVWPMVSLLNFTVMPPDKRMLFGSFIGLLWGIYICLITPP